MAPIADRTTAWSASDRVDQTIPGFAYSRRYPVSNTSSRSSSLGGKPVDKRDSGYYRAPSSIGTIDWSDSVSPHDSISQVSTKYSHQPMRSGQGSASSSRSGSSSSSRGKAMSPYRGSWQQSFTDGGCGGGSSFFGSGRSPHCCRKGDHQWNDADERPYFDERHGIMLRNVKPSWL